MFECMSASSSTSAADSDMAEMARATELVPLQSICAQVRSSSARIRQVSSAAHNLNAGQATCMDVTSTRSTVARGANLIAIGTAPNPVVGLAGTGHGLVLIFDATSETLRFTVNAHAKKSAPRP